MRGYVARFLTAGVVLAVAALLGGMCPSRGAAVETSAGPARAAHAPTQSRTLQVELSDPVEPDLPARTYDVVQTRDRNGYPLQYAMSFVTHVCTDGECLPVEVTLHWNAVGYFERLEYPLGKPLTKKDDVPFSDADYAKLDRILKDRSSLLGSWQISFLEKPVDARDGIDAVTAPTPTTVKDSVIEDAAFTTWALWHWSNGEIVPKLQQITGQSCTSEYLNHLLVSDDRQFADFALQYVKEHHAADPRFVDSVFTMLDHGERDQIKPTLDFLAGAVPDKRKLHTRLIESCCRVRAADCPLILEYLDADPALPPSTLEGLTGRLAELPYFPIHLILRMLEKRDFSSPKTISDVAALLDNDDFFIARRAYEYLGKQDLGSQTEKRVAEFRRQNRDRL